MKSILSLVCVIFLTSCSVDRPHVQTLKLNREGSKALQENKSSEAQSLFLQALQHDPFKAALHLNLGLSFEGLELSEKALKSYAEASRLADASKDHQVQFLSRFNEAQLLGKQKKVEEALEKYQAALAIYPGSEETKHNIELLIASAAGDGEGEGDSNKNDQSKQGQDQNKKDGQGKEEKKDPKSDKDSDDKSDKEKKDNPDEKQEKKSSPKYVPRPFNSQDLTEGDVKKILGELKQQESRIRSDYNKKEGKEQPRDKDW